MRPAKISMLLLTIQLCGGAELHASETQVLGLEESVRYAIDHSVTLDAIKKTEISSELNVTNSFNSFLPSLDLTSTNGAEGNNDNNVALNSGYWTSQSQISLTENLYDNGASITNYKISRLNQKVATLNENKARDQLCLSVAQEFYNYSLLTELLSVKQLQHKLVEEQYDRVSNQYRQGLSPRQDFLRFKLQVQRTDLDLVDATNQLKVSETNLRRLLSGADEANKPHYVGVDDFHFKSLPVEAFGLTIPTTAVSINHTYDFEISQTQRQANDLNVDLTVRKYWPQVNLTAGGSYSYAANPGSTSTISSGSQLSWNALVTINYNIWDWGTRKNNVAIAELAADTQNDSLDSTVLDTRQAVENLALDLTKLQTTYTLTSELLKMSEQSFAYLDQQYRLGQVQYLDLITGLNELLDAKTRYYTVYFNVLTDLAKYHFYDGNLYETLFAKK